MLVPSVALSISTPNVIVSDAAVVVTEIPELAAIVNVSSVSSATISS